ncbi:MAG: DNA cytosine methyltransferase, partial [Sinomicrobium sp.]|nr:DNA cytosine methyltransferase [Sinomicrobium sp.]
MVKKLKTISLFSGAGGCSLGFSQTEKFEIIAAYDNDKSAVETYNTNFKQKAEE